MFNAALNATAFLILNNRRYPDLLLSRLYIGLAVLFVTIAIPIELEGNWISIAWLLEALVLFVIGRTRRLIFMEYLSYPVLFAIAWNLIIGWTGRISDTDLIPFLNLYFIPTSA